VAGAAGALLAGVALAVHGGASSAALRVTVHPGDTLWAIARAHYPGDDVQARVADIEARNGLSSAGISPGRVLTLPAP
jgi:LysM repeat protein